jgi:hypothetical protein
MNIRPFTTAPLLLLAAAALPAGPAAADGELKCTMHFSLSGWSLFYKTESGQGTVSCSDGSTLAVLLHSEGGGMTAGKSSIDNGLGEFTSIYNIRDVLGDYATGSAHGAAGDGSVVAGLTKGPVSLSLKGNSHGFDVGVDAGKFTISEAPVAAVPPPPPPPPPGP